MEKSRKNRWKEINNKKKKQLYIRNMFKEIIYIEKHDEEGERNEEKVEDEENYEEEKERIETARRSKTPTRNTHRNQAWQRDEEVEREDYDDGMTEK